jgi:hypothetical protein
LALAVLSMLFVTGLSLYLTGCGVDSGSATGKPAYAVPGSGSGSGTGGGGSTPTGGGTGGGGSSPSGGGGTPDAGGSSGSGLEDELFQLINEGRERNGVAALQWDSQIASVARAYCQYMANKIGSQGYSEPYRPNMDGKSPSKRLQDGGVTFNKCDETGIIGDPVYMPPDVSTAEKAYAHLDHGKLNNPAFGRAGVGHHFEHFGG